MFIGIRLRLNYDLLAFFFWIKLQYYHLDELHTAERTLLQLFAFLYWLCFTVYSSCTYVPGCKEKTFNNVKRRI